MRLKFKKKTLINDKITNNTRIDIVFVKEIWYKNKFVTLVNNMLI